MFFFSASPTNFCRVKLPDSSIARYIVMWRPRITLTRATRHADPAIVINQALRKVKALSKLKIGHKRDVSDFESQTSSSHLCYDLNSLVVVK